MIIANITSFDGLCAEAEHYYCSYDIVDNDTKIKTYYSDGDRDLYRRILDQDEADHLNKKDTWNGWHVNMKTQKFQSIEQIHEKLIEVFPDQNIVTFYENKIFKDMLYLIDGTNVGYKIFGEIWTYIPTGVYKHLLPPEDQIKIKCDACGKEYTITEVSTEKNLTEDIVLIEFNKTRHMAMPCCKDFILIWNVVL